MPQTGAGVTNPEENGASGEGVNTGANSGASAARAPAIGEDPELADVVEAWSTLPAAVRADIVAMVRSVAEARSAQHTEA